MVFSYTVLVVKVSPERRFLTLNTFSILRIVFTLCCILANYFLQVNKKRTPVRFICSFVGAGILYATTTGIGANIPVGCKAAHCGPRAHDNFLAR